MSASKNILKILKLREVPDHSTICRMMGRINQQLLEWVLREALKEGGVAEEIITIDGTGFHKEQAIVYYQGRCGRKYRRWFKVVYGGRHKFIPEQVMGKGLGSDSAYSSRRSNKKQGIMGVSIVVFIRKLRM